MFIVLNRLSLRANKMIINRYNHSLSSLEIQEFFQEKNNLEENPKMNIRNFNIKIDQDKNNSKKNSIKPIENPKKNM
jgi:hypothetical protein